MWCHQKSLRGLKSSTTSQFLYIVIKPGIQNWLIFVLLLFSLLERTVSRYKFRYGRCLTVITGKHISWATTSTKSQASWWISCRSSYGPTQNGWVVAFIVLDIECHGRERDLTVITGKHNSWATTSTKSQASWWTSSSSPNGATQNGWVFSCISWKDKPKTWLCDLQCTMPT